MLWKHTLAIAAGVASWATVWLSVQQLAGRTAPSLFAPHRVGEQPVALVVLLAAAGLASVGAGALTARLAPGTALTPVWILASIQLAIGIAVQWSVREAFPVWYHLVFLGSVLPLHLLGGRLGATLRRPGQATAAAVIALVALSLGVTGAEATGAERIARLSLADAVGGERFGESLDARGAILVVGAPADADDGPFSGSIAVFERDAAGQWIEVANPNGSTTSAVDALGTAVAVDGTRVIAGAPFGQEAFVFARVPEAEPRSWSGGSESWVEDAVLRPPPGPSEGLFGRSVDLDGDYALVGAGFTSGATGASHVFFRDTDGDWSHAVRLTASDGEADDNFGVDVALADDRALIGASNDDEACPTDPDCDSGAAYLYQRFFAAPSSWLEQQKLLPSDPTPAARFGRSVDLRFGHALVGAPGIDAAYFFVRDELGAWVETSRLEPPPGEPDTSFGSDVRLGTEDTAPLTLLVAAPESETVYAFRRAEAGDAWRKLATLTPSAPDEGFGTAIALDGDLAFVGAPTADDACPDDPGCDSGVVEVFVLPVFADGFEAGDTSAWISSTRLSL